MRPGDRSRQVPEVPGVLDAAEVRASVDGIESVQLADGMIPWFPGGHADPWNHVEAAMALTVGGRLRAAERAYEWLADRQRPDGSWHRYYLEGSVEDPKFDANVCAYVATGAWHHFLATCDRGFLEEMWRMVEPAVDFVLDLQTARGEILWARHPDGTPWPFALLTGSSSIFHSLRCAIAIAGCVGRQRPDWELSAALLGSVIAHRPSAFAPKHRWAMDWYYPVLAGVLRGEAGRRHLARRFDDFVMHGLGVRCVSDRPWVTAAETSECAIAHHAVGDPDRARSLLGWAQLLRAPGGGYFTGMVFPDQVHFPGGEQSTYSAAAVVLAADALCGTSATAGLFGGAGLAPVLELPEGVAADRSDPAQHS